MDVSVSGNINQRKYLKKFRGASAPLAPPGSAYEKWSLIEELLNTKLKREPNWTWTPSTDDQEFD